MFLTGIEQVRAVEWGKAYLWAVRFHAEGINPVTKKPYALLTPFDDWFPAIEVEENILTLESHMFEAGISTYKIPKSTTVFDVKITFMDDMKHTLFDWFDDWVNITLLNNEEYVARLGDPGVTRTLQIAKLDSKRKAIHTDSYLVYPEGALYFHGTSEAAAHTAMMSFIIVGTPKGAHD